MPAENSDKDLYRKYHNYNQGTMGGKMRRVSLLRACLALTTQFVFPFIGGGYMLLREYRKGLATAALFNTLLIFPVSSYPYIWGDNWMLQSFETIYFVVWYLTALHCFFLGIRYNSIHNNLLNGTSFRFRLRKPSKSRLALA